MKNLLLFACFFASLSGSVVAQDSIGMTRLGRWNDPTLPIAPQYGIRYSGCWGMAINGREVAVLGAAKHVLFFDVTEPTHPQLIAKFTGNTSTGWREFKSYRNRIYAVSDASNEGLMVFDLSAYPADTIARTYWSNDLFQSSHTIELDTATGRIYLNAVYSPSINANLMVLDVSQDPDQPALLAALNPPGGYPHDSFVRDNLLYASSGDNGLFVYDVTAPADSLPVRASISTGGYNHNVWLTEDSQYAYYTEEIPDGRPIRIVDLHDLANGTIEVVGSFLDNMLFPGAPVPEAIPHNVYVKDNLLFDSQYEDGLLVYDITVPIAPVLVGWYDTHPQNTQYNQYKGNWGNYPWLPSGTIIAGDMQNGLQLLRLLTPSAAPEVALALPMTLFPNPAHDALTVRMPNVEGARNWSYRLFNTLGQVVLAGKATHAAETTLKLNDVAPGPYYLEVRAGSGSAFRQSVIVE